MGQNGQRHTVGKGRSVLVSKKKKRECTTGQSHFISCIRRLCQSCTADKVSSVMKCPVVTVSNK